MQALPRRRSIRGPVDKFAETGMGERLALPAVLNLADIDFFPFAKERSAAGTDRARVETASAAYDLGALRATWATQLAGK